MGKSWTFLKPGDMIDVIAPSSLPTSSNLNLYFQQIKAIFDSIGITLRINIDLIEPGKDLFAANSEQYRAKHLKYALSNNESSAVWALRGGYGAAELIPFLENMDPPKEAKLLLGFSDITALHLFLNNKWHWNSLHSPVLSQFITNPLLLEPIKTLIFGMEEEIHYSNITPLNMASKNEENITASITGGNLSLVQTSLATSWQINGKDKIIFLEDLDERGYKIDRMLNHLLQAKVFDHAKAIIFGEITPNLEKDEINLCIPAIIEFANKMDIPVLHLPSIGHNINQNLPLPLGSDCNLILGEEPSLTCKSGGIGIC